MPVVTLADVRAKLSKLVERAARSDPIRKIHVSAILLVGALALCACAPTSKTDSQIILAPEPEANSGYALAGRADSSNTVVITRDRSETMLAFLQLMAILAYKDKDGELAFGVETNGGGTSPEDAIEFPGLEKQETAVRVALSYIANRFPDRRAISAQLYHGPGDVFVTRISFETMQRSNALYFDLTAWAAAWRAVLGK
jgi:hypothetical protein